MASDYSATVAQEIIDRMEAGTAPWQKPWKPGELSAAYNPTTGKAYRGFNQMWLNFQPYGDPRWMTYKQADAVGAQVRKGERGTTIEYWQWTKEEPAKDAAGKTIKDAEGKSVMRTVELQSPRRFYARVFNAEQMDGLEPLPPRTVKSEWERHQLAERIIAASPAPVRHLEGDAAYYEPSWDRITLPLPEQFDTPDLYYSTAFHEIGHSSGHETRLNRDLAHPFGSEAYAKEELVAELSSFMMAQRLEMEFNPDRHVSYLEGWLRALKKDPREIFRAAAEAEKVVEWVIGLELAQEITVEQKAELAAEAALRADFEASLDSPAHAFAERAADLAGDASIDADEVEAILEREFPMKDRAEPAHMADERVDLNVPFSQKNAAKAAGAKWDKQDKTWYAPAGTNLAPLAQWLENEQAVGQAPARPAEEQFLDALKAHGLIVTGLPVMDGKMVRVPVEGDRKSPDGRYYEQSGAYVGHNDVEKGGYPAGYIQNFRTGKKENWKMEGRVTGLTNEDRVRLEREAAERAAEKAAAELARHERAAEQVGKILEEVEPAAAHNRYLKNKDLDPSGVQTLKAAHAITPEGDEPQRFGGEGHIIVPAHDIDGKVWTAQAIAPNGRKSFPKGARLQGCHNLIGDLAGDKPILFAEGWATGRDLHEQTKMPVAVCFNAGNLEAVAREYRARFPDRSLVIAGDNDHAKELEIDPSTNEPRPNVGKVKAIQASMAVDGFALLPNFPAGGRGSDWNDLRRSQGRDVMLQQLRTGLAVAVRRERSQDLTRSRGTVREGPDEDQRREIRRDLAKERAGEAPDHHRDRRDRDDDNRKRSPVLAAGIGR